MRERSRLRSTRREFLKRAAFTGTAAVLDPETSRAQGEPAPAVDGTPAEASGPGFFRDEERRALAALADSLLPGAARWGAVEYVEGLLTAFDHDPPRIHAGGPFSGRHPWSENGKPTDRHPEDDFQHFLPLSRLQEHAWRLRLFGSDAVPRPNEGLLPPVTGLRPMFQDGAARAARLLRAGSSAASVLRALPEEFREAFTGLVLEASFGDPIYGGNRAGAGWAAIHFEGDSLPLGYTLYDASAGVYRERPDAPVSRFASGPGPDPLGFWTRVWLRVVSFLTLRFVS